VKFESLAEFEWFLPKFW